MATSTLGNGTLVLAGTTSGTTTVTATAVAGTTTLTLPAATDTLVGKATTDTLTNKTLTGAAMNGTLGATTPSTASVTTLTTSSTVTHSGGTANGVAYLDGSKVLTTGSALVFDGTNLGVGVTPYNPVGATMTSLTVQGSAYGTLYVQANSAAVRGTFNATSANNTVNLAALTNHPLTFATNDTERARIDSSGNLLVGTTSVLSSNRKLNVLDGGGIPAVFKQASSSGNECLDLWNSATTGNNAFVEFQTDAGAARGTITYNRAGGLVAYNTTSDYRAKDISGPVTSSGSLIDSVPVYMGTMKGATQERPMFIAHETPAYAHTGEKDAVDADGKPVYQQMDASSLIPVMWAEIQSLRQRLAAANL